MIDALVLSVAATSLCASANPWLAACDHVDALPSSADVATVALLLIAFGVTERLRRAR